MVFEVRLTRYDVNGSLPIFFKNPVLDNASKVTNDLSKVQVHVSPTMVLNEVEYSAWIEICLEMLSRS